MIRQKIVAIVAATGLAGFAFGVQAQTKGGLTCPKGKVEAKSFAAYYVPAKSALTIFFYKDAMDDEELDALMAERSKFDAGDNAKGPGTGKPTTKYRSYAFKAWMRVSQKPGGTVTAADIAKSVYFSYTCESMERVISYDFKEKEAKLKAAFPAASIELKQGGKIRLTSKGAWDGDPKDKDRIKVAWDIQGTGKLRVYE